MADPLEIKRAHHARVIDIAARLDELLDEMIAVDISHTDLTHLAQAWQLHVGVPDDMRERVKEWLRQRMRKAD